MYVLSKSVLEHIGNYRGEVYEMEMLSHDANVHIELKIFGEGDSEYYVGDYNITKADGETTWGTCLNQPTKEATIEAIEENVIRILEDKDHYKILRLE